MTLLARFEALEIDPESFRHEDHVRVGYELLQRYDFLDAFTRCARTIKKMAALAGAPQKFNLTITLAFMSLIAERLADRSADDYASFIAANGDLLDKDALSPWYGRDELMSHKARAQFLMPRRVDAAIRGAN